MNPSPANWPGQPLTVLTGPRPLLTFRPEAVRIGPGAVNSLQAQVTERTYLGTQTRLKLSVGATVVEAVLSPDLVEGIGPGDSVTVNLPPQSLRVMEPDRSGGAK
jgi:ABC-type Fe3+/spermidine/putrescine transport system ATPase subunit